MVIYPFPPQLTQNPYLDDLYGALPAEIRVDRRSPRRSWWRMCLSSGTRILHLHFFDALVQHPQRLRCVIRAWRWTLLLWFIRLLGVRIVWTVHNLQPHECFHPDIAERTCSRVMAVCAALTVHHHATKNAIQARFPQIQTPIIVIPHGHQPEPFGPMPTRAAARRALGLDPERSVILFLGLIRRYKGLETLIDAMSLLPQTLLIIAGHPSDKTYLSEIHRRSARSVNISLHPQFLENSLAARYIAAADALVLPYTAVTTSGMLVAAQAAGVTCIVPNVPALVESVRDGVSGFVFLGGDAASLAHAIERMEQHPDRARIGAAARAAQAAHTWPVVAQQFARLYASIARGTQ